MPRSMAVRMMRMLSCTVFLHADVIAAESQERDLLARAAQRAVAHVAANGLFGLPEWSAAASRLLGRAGGVATEAENPVAATELRRRPRPFSESRDVP